MKALAKRVAIVAGVHLLAFEVLCWLCVRWPESTGEQALVILYLLTIGGLVWAVLPGFAERQKLSARIAFRAAGILALSTGLLTVDNVYAWHVRPNVGLYQEDAWVAQHPGFQRELRARIEANRWGLPTQR